MRVFVTGATGFIGSAIVRELLDAGHQVVGLARSEASAKRLVAAGAEAHRGSIEDLKSLRSGASSAEGAIHTAFFHDFSYPSPITRLRVIFGGRPSGIVTRFLGFALDADRRAIETIGKALVGSDRALVAAFGTMAMRPGQLASEDDPYDPEAVGGMRGATEDAVSALGASGVRGTAIRLPPIVHGDGDRLGFLPRLIQTARKKRDSAYVGDGLNRWPAVHRLDAARVFRLALEKGPSGSKYHAIAEEGLAFRQIAEAIGGRLNVPVVGQTPEEAARRFSFLAPFLSADNPVSSRLTRERLGWTPTHPGLLADLAGSSYFGA